MAKNLLTSFQVVYMSNVLNKYNDVIISVIVKVVLQLFSEIKVV